MKIGLIADIHCNVTGLKQALKFLDDCEEVLCAGDLLCLYRFSSEVLNILQHNRVHSIVGNHDKTILYSPEHPLRFSSSVNTTDLKYLSDLPESLYLSLGGMRVAMFHGSPWDEKDTYAAYSVYPSVREDIQRVAEINADIIVLGHTHQPFFDRSENATLVVNPGSCGESRSPDGLLSCARLDTVSGHVEFHRFSPELTASLPSQRLANGGFQVL